MTDTETVVGLAGYGLYFPESFETAEEIAASAGLTSEEVRALGIEKKHRPGSDDQPVTMAARAALKAFEANPDLDPSEVDVVIYTGEEYKDYIAQTAAIRLQEEIGCRKAWAFDLVGQGTTSIVGLRAARDLMIGDESVRTVLLAGGTRNVDLVDYKNPDARFLLASSASGGAMILEKGLKKNRLLGLAFQTDPEMADEVYVPGGGTEIPFGPDNLGSPLMSYQVQNPVVVSGYLKDKWPVRLAQAAREAAEGNSPDFLALRHLDPAGRGRVLGELGLDPDRSPSLAEWGHHGPNDVILALELGLKSEAVHSGGLVVMLSGGIGFTQAAAAFRWGE